MMGPIHDLDQVMIVILHPGCQCKVVSQCFLFHVSVNSALIKSDPLNKAVALQVPTGMLVFQPNKIISSTMTCHGLSWIPTKNAVILLVCTCWTSMTNHCSLNSHLPKLLDT